MIEFDDIEDQHLGRLTREAMQQRPSVCEVVYHAANCTTIYGEIEGTCRITGKHNKKGVLFSKWVRDTFTDHAYLYAGTIISNEALFCFEESSTLIQSMRGKDKPQRFRTYSHFVHDGKWYCFGKDQKAEMLPLLFSDKTTVAVIADSGQKHLVFKYKFGTWKFEEENIIIDRNKLAIIHSTMYDMGQVFSVDEVAANNYQQHRIMQYGLEKWLQDESVLAQHRGSALFNLALFFIKIKGDCYDNPRGKASAKGDR